MKNISELNHQHLGHMTAICLLAVTLSACGGATTSGGNSGDEGTDTQDLFGGGDTTDSDGDGLSDTNEEIQGSDPLIIDTDGDGLDDLQEWNAFSDPTKVDSDGDGTSDLDEFNAGTSLTDPNDGGDTSVVAEPTTDQCDDPTSSNDAWVDNCVVKRYGTYAQSSYAQGIQRILWCQSSDLQSAITIDNFSDGAFGPASSEALRNYQLANGLDPDQVVGMNTWNSLRSKLFVIEFAATLPGFDTYGIDGCAENAPQFFQNVQGTGTFDAAGEEIIELGGWSMARTAGSNIQVEFSSGPAN